MVATQTDLAEKGGALLNHLSRILVELLWLCELVHEKLGLIRLLPCKILHLALQEHQAAVPGVQLIPHTLKNRTEMWIRISSQGTGAAPAGWNEIQCTIIVIQNMGSFMSKE